jgi:RNA polymerase sigma factor for flagellar operon FliA
MGVRSPLTADQQRLVQDSLGLVQRVARRVARRFPRTRLDEVVSAGQEALVEAARTFDLARGVPFEGFAFTRVHGEMRDHAMREAVPLRERLLRAIVLGGPPQVSDSEEGGDESIAEARSLAGSWARDRATEFAISYLLATPAVDPEVHLEGARERALASQALGEAMAALDTEDAALARAHYIDGVSIPQIAEGAGVAARTVQRQHRRLLETLRKSLAKCGVTSTAACD